ncbi:MAG TPA: vWA domain-containing protein [Polyangia bacterium]|nr:vWA domain-containing protein [Polyangia bacterium]
MSARNARPPAPGAVALGLGVLLSVLPPILAIGCGGTLKVTKLGASAQRPANIALFLSVFDKMGQPVGGLALANFRVYEDKKLISDSKGKRALLDTGIASSRYALLLLDLSGPMVDSEDLPELAKAVGAFVDKVGASQSVAVDVFDGNDEVAPLFGFGANMSTEKIVAAVRQFRPRNRNSNLNGAVYQGLHALKEQLDQATTPEKGAELVVFTDRGDLSHSVNAAVLEQALKETPVDVYVIAAGEKVSRPEIAAIGHNGIFVSNDPKAFKKGFEQVTAKLATVSDGRYIFSYCTPKRRGDHELQLEVAVPGDTGRVSYKFDADSFKAGCSPKRRPSFSALTKAAKPPPPPSADQEAAASDDDR